MSNTNLNNINKKSKLVPPDGGWGYAICFGFTLINLIVIAPKNCSGLLFKDLINESESGAKVFTAIIAICGITIAFSGLIVNLCLKWFSLRVVCVLSTVIYVLCWFCDIFATDVTHLIIGEGILKGLGTGMLNVVCYVVFNSYFAKKRVMVMSICMTIVGLGAIIAPFVIENWLKVYGYKGTLAMIAIISANNFVGAALFQPVEWHLVTATEDAGELAVESDEQNIDIEVIESGKETNQELVKPLMIENNVFQSLGCINYDYKNVEDLEKVKENTWSKINSAFNFKLLKNITFYNIAFGNGIGIVSDINFCMMLPLLLYEYGFSNTDVATCISIISVADLLSRIVLSVTGKFVNIVSFHWYYAALIFTFVGRLLFLQFTNFYAIALTLSLLGFLRAWFHIFYPLLVAEELPQENYAKVFGVSFLAHGICNIVFAPLLSYPIQITGSYLTTFYVLAISVLIPITTYTYELCFVRPRRKPRNE